MSHMQGFAAGLMLSISFLDLAHNAINSIGFLKGNLWVSFTFYIHQFECVYSHAFAYSYFSNKSIMVSWQCSFLPVLYSLLLLPISSQNHHLLQLLIWKVTRLWNFILPISMINCDLLAFTIDSGCFYVLLIYLLVYWQFDIVLENRKMGMTGARILWKSTAAKFYLVESLLLLVWLYW